MSDIGAESKTSARSSPGGSGRRTPTSVARALRELGEHAATWRKLQRLPAATVAARAGISRSTLYEIEHGSGKASTENLFRVLNVLGILRPIVSAADPYTTDVGKLRADEVLPERVRRR
jgi:transcriptional regulator with XRE-family HTH domain